MDNNPVLLSFGGNLGNSEVFFQSALSRLMTAGFYLLARSKIYRSPAVGCEPGAPDFKNISVLGNWNDNPRELLKLCQKIESEFGRPNIHPHWVSRTLDIDLIVCGGLILNTSDFILPHPLTAERNFVVVPSAEIAPFLLLPGKNIVFSELAEKFTN